MQILWHFKIFSDLNRTILTLFTKSKKSSETETSVIKMLFSMLDDRKHGSSWETKLVFTVYFLLKLSVHDFRIIQEQDYSYWNWFYLNLLVFLFILFTLFALKQHWHNTDKSLIEVFYYLMMWYALNHYIFIAIFI